MRVYATINDYITANIAPGLGDVELTDEQAYEVAHRMTEWNEDGNLIERTDRDFWEEVANVLGDN